MMAEQTYRQVYVPHNHCCQIAQQNEKQLYFLVMVHQRIVSRRVVQLHITSRPINMTLYYLILITIQVGSAEELAVEIVIIFQLVCLEINILSTDTQLRLMESQLSLKQSTL